eukprot:15285583-Alexandrium_andersonii.AAC.1
MSASLVGSEMCIRDRPVQRIAVRAPAGATREQRPWRGRPTASTQRGHACLLYTSDAADDM